jgi:uncharacterized protein (UPF0297 family)
MGVKENVEKNINENLTDAKNLWEEIYKAFSEKGSNSLNKFLEEKKGKIFSEFEKIYKEIENKIIK